LFLIQKNSSLGYICCLCCREQRLKQKAAARLLEQREQKKKAQEELKKEAQQEHKGKHISSKEVQGCMDDENAVQQFKRRRLGREGINYDDRCVFIVHVQYRHHVCDLHVLL
jgi:hypothetical protein